jgi:hypothetical protein
MMTLAVLIREVSRLLGLRSRARPRLDLRSVETTRPAPCSDIPHRPRRWLIAAGLPAGAPVFDPDGQQSGLIRDLSIDKRSGRVIYALVAFGALQAIGGDLHPLPWPLLRYDLERDGYVLPFESSAIAGGPHLTADELPWFGVSDDDWRTRLDAYYETHLLAPFV